MADFPYPADIEIPDPESNDVEKSDLFYELYRYGLITRHICANGRIDENTWLKQIKLESASDNIKGNIRYRRERFWYVDPADSTEKIKEETLAWEPICRKSKEPGNFQLASLGSGDNPLLRTGLALAFFSLEAKHGVSGSSNLYAKHAFNFLCESEYQKKGFFLRKEADRARVKYASTDEMLGICFGLLFYFKYLTESKRDPDELANVVALVARIANNMNAHGYWILPYADDYKNSSLLQNALLDREGNQNWTTQTGFAFGYAFRLFFETITGIKTNVRWDKDEFKKYFPESIFDGNNIGGIKWMAAAEFSQTSDPSVKDQILSAATFGTLPSLLRGDLFGALFGLVGNAIGYIFGGPAVPITYNIIEDVNLTFDERNFFINLCKIVEKALNPDSDVLVNALLWTLAVEQKVFNWCRLPIDIVPDPTANYFNYHMLALASIIAQECSPDDEVGKHVSKAMDSLLINDDGKGNALFAILKDHFGERTCQDTIDLLIHTLPAEGDCFQHDLPLSHLEFIRRLSHVNGDEDLNEDDKTKFRKLRGRIDTGVGMPEGIWRAKLRSEKLPFNLNLDRRWGGSRTWEQKSGNHFAAENNLDPDNNEPYDFAEVIRAIIHDVPCGIAMESCGIDFLYARILAYHYGLLRLPKLPVSRRDRIWPILPYYGASPCNNLPSFSIQIRTDEVAPRPQKRLVALTWKDGRSETGTYDPRTQLIKGPTLTYGKDGYIKGHFRGRRIFSYDIDYELPLEFYINNSGSSFGSWEFYAQIQPLPGMASEKWLPHDGALRIGAGGMTAIQNVRTTNQTPLIKIDGKQIRSLLSSSCCCVSINIRFIPDRQGPTTSKPLIRFIPDVIKTSYRLNEIPKDSPYRYLLNAHQGTIHDFKNCSAIYTNNILQTFNAVLLPIDQTISHETPLQELQQLLRKIGVPVAFPRRDGYRGWPPPRFRRWLEDHPTQKNEYEQRNLRSLRLCTHCFGKKN